MNMTHPEHRSDAGLATALRISVSRLARRLRVERTVPGLTEPDLSETQLAALAALERHGAMTPGELADHEKVQPPSMTRVISVLVEAQLVRRGPGTGEPGPAPAGRVAGEAAEGTHPRRAGDAAGRRAHPGEAQSVLSEAAPSLAAPEAAGSRSGGASRFGWPQTFRSLSTRNYRLFAAGQVVSNTGTWMQRVAQDWLVLQLTHGSGTALGLAIGLQFLPQLLFSLWGGVIADRYRKRNILLATQAVMGMLALVLGVLALTGAVAVWQVYLLAFALGLVAVVDNPARQTFVAEMVGREGLANAVALNSATFNLARITGPAVAGLVIA